MNFDLVIFLNGSYMSVVDGKNFSRYFMIPKNECNSIPVGGISVSVHNIFGLYSFSRYHLPKDGILVHMKWHVFFNGISVSPVSMVPAIIIIPYN